MGARPENCNLVRNLLNERPMLGAFGSSRSSAGMPPNPHPHLHPPPHDLQNLLQIYWALGVFSLRFPRIIGKRQSLLDFLGGGGLGRGRKLSRARLRRSGQPSVQASVHNYYFSTQKTRECTKIARNRHSLGFFTADVGIAQGVSAAAVGIRLPVLFAEQIAMRWRFRVARKSRILGPQRSA